MKPDPSLEALIREIEAEARRAEFPVEREAYLRAGRDPLVPILHAGSLEARVCSFGRDLGRDEVRYGQPQVGPAGRLVRRGVLASLGEAAPPEDRLLESALGHVFLTNTVPYKPPDNQAYPEPVRSRFRPYLARLLVCHWRGDAVLTLGTEAFQWFRPFLGAEIADPFWTRPDRYEADLPCALTAECDGETVCRTLTLCPLPHPSPLNRRWLALFPDLLRGRLEKWLA